MVIIVVSDTHLGYDKSEHIKFENFLESLKQREDVTNFVILGDFIDMWRRDVSGIFLEFQSILGRILSLNDKITVSCVAGNHDYHLLQLFDVHNPHKDEYPLKFQKDLVISEDGIKYHFMHGHEFDTMQKEPLMELLCYTMSDNVGEVKSDFWSWITSIGTDFKFLENFFRFHKNEASSDILTKLKALGPSAFADMENLMKTPSDRNLNVASVEKAALDHLIKYHDDKLIFGHTHVPFVTPENNLANSGSWLNNETTYNTHIEIKEGQIRLFQDEIDITNKFTRHAGS